MIGDESVPMFFQCFADNKNPGKKACFNSVMKDWMLSGDALVNVGNIQTDECEHNKLSTFVAHMKCLDSELNAHDDYFNVESGF